MTELKMIHVLMFMIAVFLLYHLIGNCGCANRVVDGFNVGAKPINLIYLKDINDAKCYNSLSNPTACCNGGIINDWDKCDEYFIYDKTRKEMIGCVLNSTTINGYDESICNTVNNNKKYINAGICSNKSCPSCNDPTFYSINGSNCTDNLDICLKCKSASNISWKNTSSKNRNLAEQGQADYQYNGSNPLHDCKDTSDFCKTKQDNCINNLHIKVDQDINNSGTSCSIVDIKNTIDKNSYIIQDCTYDEIKIDQDNKIIDVYLNEKGYCDPENKKWECNRSIPSDCSKKNSTCTYDIHQQKCIRVCNPPYELLNNDECGKPDCNHITGGLCKKGFKCEPFTLPKTGVTTYSCIKDDDDV